VRSKDRRRFSETSKLKQMISQSSSNSSVNVEHLSSRELVIRKARKMLESRIFDYFMGTIIVLNSICLGVQSELSLPGGPGEPPILEVFENFFLALYVIEAALNIITRGWSCFRDPWFVFDFSLVFIGTSYQWCLKFAINEDEGGFLQQVLVLRTLRLLRLLRALRLLPMLRVVWRLIYGLLTSTNTMLSTMALIVLMLYMFGCLGLELITKDASIQGDPELQKLVQEYFPGLYGSMVTLLQFVTLDSVSGIYGPLVRSKPALLLYFLPILLIVSISLMNMVTAVLVEGALSQANNDREARKHFLVTKIKEMTPVYKELFRNLDENGNGVVTVGELINVTDDDIPDPFKKALADFKLESMVELFEVLDGDTSGHITEDEFIDGLLNLSLSEFNAVPPEIIVILKLSRSLTRKTSEQLRVMAECREHLRNVTEILNAQKQAMMTN